MCLMVLLLMIFLHMIDDYVLQGWLASAKSKEWWKKNAPLNLYSRDYIMALLEHGFMNSFLIHIPLWYKMPEKFIYALPVTIIFLTFFHAFVDHCKANLKLINLIQDQVLHFLSIILIWLFYVLLTKCPL